MRIEITKIQRVALENASKNESYSLHLRVELHDIVKTYDKEIADSVDLAKAIQQARRQYPSRDIEFDEEPAVSIGSVGTWVAAWVLVENE